MDEIKLIIGDYFYDILCESFLDPETGRVRVRPLPDQGLSTKLVIECSRQARKSNPVGTIFRAETVKVCEKDVGRIYLRAKDQKITKIEEDQDDQSMLT